MSGASGLRKHGHLSAGDGGTITAYSAGGTDVPVTDGGTGASTASGARTNLGLVIGTDVQAFDSDIPTVSASQAEMEAGTGTSLRSMTPQRVAQAIAALGGAGGSAYLLEPVFVATTGPITISTALNSGDSIDGVTLTTGNRVLVKNQASDVDNGIYIVGVSPARSSDWSVSSNPYGKAVMVFAGSTLHETLWLSQADSGDVIGTNDTVFSNVAGAVGMSDPMTTRGDMIYRDGGNLTARLPIGTAGRILTSNGTDAAWGEGPLTTTGDLLIGASGAAPTRLAAGSTSGHVLTSNGSGVAPSWQASSGGGGGGSATAEVNAAGRVYAYATFR